MSRVRAGESFLVVVAPSRRGSGLAAERGDAFVELVVVAPLLLLMLGVAVVMGQVLDAKASAADVAREAARVAVEQPGAWGGGDAATKAARSRAAALGLDASALQVVVDPAGLQPGRTYTVVVRYQVHLRGVPSLGLLPETVAVAARDVEPVAPNASVAGAAG